MKRYWYNLLLGAAATLLLGGAFADERRSETLAEEYNDMALHEQAYTLVLVAEQTNAGIVYASSLTAGPYTDKGLCIRELNRFIEFVRSEGAVVKYYDCLEGIVSVGA